MYVNIGTGATAQTWMAENLNYDATGSQCYGGISDNCAIYGKLYDRSTAMNGSGVSSANPSGVQGICPSKWHLPSLEEWKVLKSFVSDVMASLKTTTMWNSGTGYIAGTDNHGFSALPGGLHGNNGFIDIGNQGRWWTTSYRNSNSNEVWRILNNYATAIDNAGASSGWISSVRCIQDKEN